MKAAWAIGGAFGLLAVWFSFFQPHSHLLFEKKEKDFVLSAQAQDRRDANGGWDLFVTISDQHNLLFEGTVIKSVDELGDMKRGDERVTDLALDPQHQTMTITFAGRKSVTIPAVLGRFEADIR